MAERAVLALAGCVIALGLGGAAEPKVLKVCADPNNLPFSNRAGEGFENRLAELVAKDLGARLEYSWWAQRRGFARNTLKQGRCDLWPGVASEVEALATTSPYYRSSYVFVTRKGKFPGLSSFDDPRLKSAVIGVQMIGDDATNTPPAHALARRGLVRNVRGYMLYGDYTKPNPPAEIIKAVDRGNIDVAVAWGPLAGYFAAKAAHPLTVAMVSPRQDGGQWPMAFSISMGLRKDDAGLRRQVEGVLQRRRREISGLLSAYHVPLAAEGRTPARAAQVLKPSGPDAHPSGGN